MNPNQSRLQTFIKAATLLVLLFTGSHVINSLAAAQETKEPAAPPLMDSRQIETSLTNGVVIDLNQTSSHSDKNIPVTSITTYYYQDDPLTNQDICAEAWDVEVDVVPQWLQTPVLSEQLHTEIAYNFLAGRLITNGLVDASECENNGVFFNGAANACGLAQALPMVIVWQNQFDEVILQAAKDNHVPAYLLKKLFARETQFWPGTTWIEFEYGLGQATSFGLDALFQYYPDYFRTICPEIFTADTCTESYAELSPTDQALMRGYFASHFLKADCDTCEGNIDIAKVNSSIDLFAKLLVANCHQVNQIMVNVTDKPGGKYSSYEDLWRFTLVNYNAGSGCVNNSIDELYKDEKKINWDNFANELINQGNVCAGSIDYTFEISR
ncbi:MAG: hypothetical protein LLG42_09045 [Chloroflexi bacterium]|nr:hypothetical protein [Chloroflexota bacterium]